MTESADRGVLRALEALVGALAELKSPSMVIGGIAVIARGVPRQTVDIDALLWGEEVEIDQLLERLQRHQIVPRIRDAAAFARQRQVLLLRHDPSRTPLDLSLGWLPFEREALERSTTVDFAGVRINVATAEDLIILKAVAWRDRDRSDIERLYRLHRHQVDKERVLRIVAEFMSALDDPERVAALEAILRRVDQEGA